MGTDPSRQYFETQIQTASPEQLLLLLFEGALRFGRQGVERLNAEDYDGAHHLLVKAQQIVLELMYSLDRAIGEEVYANLIGLYRFAYLRLVRANVNRDGFPAEEALKILENLRETWALAIEKNREGLKRPDRPEGGMSIEG